MEASTLTSTEKYAAAALFAVALHQSQMHQTRPSDPVLPLDEEPIGEGASIGTSVSVSDDPRLWIHENSGLLLPVFRFLGVEDQAWDGLKETAGNSSQVRHHVGAETAPEMASEDKSPKESGNETYEKHIEEAGLLNHQKKVKVLFELLSACVADYSKEDKESCQPGKGYDARHRVALRLLASWLGIEWTEMVAMEIVVACSLMNTLKVDGAKEDENGTSQNHWVNWKRGGVIGGAALAGGTLMAITGGLAAPAIAHGLGALAPTLGSIIPVVGVSGFAAAAASATGSAAGSIAVAASFGAAGAGLTGSKMAKRTGSVEEFEFKEIGENHNQGRLAVGILVSGLVLEDEDFTRPWECHNENLERYALRWESKNLIALSTAIQDLLTSKIAMHLMKEGAMLTVLSTLLTALALPATLLTASDIIDSKWAVAVDRSDKAGRLLAEVLLKGLQGNRPVTLVGFSLGARVIFKCLECLAETEGANAGFVERVVLLGAPLSIKGERWEAVRKMVAGRFVNVYSTKDWTLGIIYRASLLSQGLAGIQPVDTHGVENVDVTQLIEGHSSYLWATKQILEQLDLEHYYPVFRSTDTEPLEKESLAI
ncbi:transmembrane and coiled-coil domain-containing protein 4-like isoform X2 [Tripterygium wilfordii]|uniref:transmembrane and coiled-coil domain-containing protein 4-like isoform X2 n=1 Tax=Tripterygium wilfordii TaxID=458696 RepID=UPI0018F80EA9|nr:transmembrane and coiled-coil domain-containing protein 4-like isoform X2 [Tripterygium wilfordii]